MYDRVSLRLPGGGKKAHSVFVAVIGVLLNVFLMLHAPSSVSAATSSELIPNDPYWDRQWYLRQIHAPEAWSVTTGTSSVIVAVLDTGIDITHPDIQENIWTNTKEIPGDGIDNDQDGYIDDVHGWNFVNQSADVQPLRKPGQSLEALSHGTAVASLIGGKGNNGIGIAGVAWNVRLLPVVVLDAEGAGRLESLMEAVRYAINHGASIINLSLAGLDYDEQLDQLMRHAAQAGVTVVVATGNDASSKVGLNVDKTPVYPACMDGNINAVLGISGTDTLDQKAPYANAGATCTDLSAPAQQIFAARPMDAQSTSSHPGYISGMTGTSLAAPLVSGVAALIKSLQPTWTAQQIRERLIASTDAVEDATVAVHGRLGSGRVNAAKAVEGLMPHVSAATLSLAATSTQVIPPAIPKKKVKKVLKIKRVKPIVSVLRQK